MTDREEYQYEENEEWIKTIQIEENEMNWSWYEEWLKNQNKKEVK